MKILTHAAAVSSISVDLQGNNLVSTGLDGKMRVWDLRNYKYFFNHYSDPLSHRHITQD